MSKSSKTQIILKNKTTKIESTVSEQPLKSQPASDCLPCKAKAQTLWKIYVHHTDFFKDASKSQENYKTLGDALQQFANFSASHVQSVFTSMTLLPNEWHLIYSGNEQSATGIHNALSLAGMRPKIEASLKTF